MLAMRFFRLSAGQSGDGSTSGEEWEARVLGSAQPCQSPLQLQGSLGLLLVFWGSQ